MKYEDLLDAHLKYGTDKKDILLLYGYDKILENVVIAPWWEHSLFEGLGFKIEKISNKVYNFYGDKVSFSFIESKTIGAAGIFDDIMSLGVSKCKNLIFLGSAGSVDNNIKIGDIVIPEYSICGDGASRYLNKNLEDEFLKKEYPTKDLTNKLINILKKDNIRYHYVPNYSIDSVFAEFYHLDKIIDLSTKTIEMETACFFKCNELLNINMTAILCISDNIVINKSLYSGRTEKDEEYRHDIRYNIIPKIVVKLFENIIEK